MEINSDFEISRVDCIFHVSDFLFMEGHSPVKANFVEHLYLKAGGGGGGISFLLRVIFLRAAFIHLKLCFALFILYKS